MSRDVALFEPWGLGDLAISLQLARNAADCGLVPTLFCDPRYVEWAKTFPFIKEVREIPVPWTRKKGKYSLATYPWNTWRTIKHDFRDQKFKFIIEPRRDLRASLLLKYVFSAPRMQPRSRSEGIGYKRLEILPSLKRPPVPLESPPSFVCFFGAEWANRRVPEWKTPLFINILRETGHPVAVIVPPEESKRPFYRNLSQVGIKTIEGSVSEVAEKMASYTHCISTDSSWLHVARLYGLKTMGLFGFDSVSEWSPPGSAVLRSEHCLPGPARYSKRCEELQPLGTLRIELFEKMIKGLLTPNPILETEK